MSHPPKPLAPATSALPDDAMPGLFNAADQSSLEGQRRYLQATRTRLVLIVLAAVTAAVSLRVGRTPVDVMALGTAVAFVASALVELYLLTEKPEQTWYDGRAVAESVKTLAWRFAVGGAPFPKEGDTDEEHVAQRFRKQIEGLLHDTPVPSIGVTTLPAISPAMRDLRTGTLEVRKQAYLAGRVLDQQRWYAAKAGFNRKRAHGWRVALLMTELLGVIAALLRALDVVSIDLPGIAAAAVGVGATWLAVKQHDSLARAYAMAANELGIAYSRLEDVVHEDAWAAEVADTEEAISREHTMWRASRTAFGRQSS